MPKYKNGTGGNRTSTEAEEYYISNTNTGTKSTRITARIAEAGKTGDDSNRNDTANWGAGASRSLYSVFSNPGGKEMLNRDLFKSRLWKGVPQLTEEQMKAFEAAYTGHQFFFIIDIPRFMSQGIYKDRNLHQQIRNLKSIIERASVGFSGFSPITAEFDTQEDGNGRKMSHMTRVYKEQTDISLRLHEFAGLPVKNAIESWLTGVYDPYSEHGNYHGNLGIPGGWCTANHTMSMLVVQVDPSWTEIQDAAYYFNMMPTEVPFDHFQWTKGEHTIVQDYDLQFNCNEFRGPSIMYAAEKFMNARILSMVSTSVFNSRQFVPNLFDADGNGGDPGKLAYNGFAQEIGTNGTIIDTYQFNQNITNSGVADNSNIIKNWATEEATVSNEYHDKGESDSYTSANGKTNNTANE